MIEESKYCSDVIKKRFNRELIMTREDHKILRSLLNVGSVIMLMLMVMLRYYATFYVRNLNCCSTTLIHVCKKTTTCIGLQAEQIFS